MLSHTLVSSRNVNFPSQDALLGRKALKEIHGNWVGVAAPGGHEALGRALRPLVEEYALPSWWLVDSEGEVLGISDLAAVQTACQLALQAGEDYFFWPDAALAVDVINGELPRLHAKVRAQLTPRSVVEPEPEVIETPAHPIVTIGTGEAIGTTTVDSLPEWWTALTPEARTEAINLGKAIMRGIMLAPAAMEASAPKPTRRLAIESTYADPDGNVRFTPGLIIRAPLMRNGEVVKTDGKTQMAIQVCCTGKRGGCKRLTPVGEARVAKSLQSLRAAIGVRKLEEMTEGRVLNVSLCDRCAADLLPGPDGSQSVHEALDKVDAEIERSKTATIAALCEKFGGSRQQKLRN